MKERNRNLQSLQELIDLKSNLEQKLAESHKNYKELLEAKEKEANNFNEGIEKLIKFKNQVKELL